MIPIKILVEPQYMKYIPQDLISSNITFLSEWDSKLTLDPAFPIVFAIMKNLDEKWTVFLEQALKNKKVIHCYLIDFNKHNLLTLVELGVQHLFTQKQFTLHAFFQHIKTINQNSLENKRTYYLPTNEKSLEQVLWTNEHIVLLLINPTTGKIDYANRAAVLYYGYAHSTLTSMKIQDINILSEKEIKAEMERAKKLQKTRFNFKHKLADGSIRDVEVQSGKVTYNKTIYLFSIIKDVTQQKDNIKNILISEQRLNAVINCSKDGFLIWDNTLNFYTNTHFFDIIEDDKKDTQSFIKSWRKFIYKDNKEDIIPKIESFFSQTKKGFHTETIRIITKKNTIKHCRIMLQKFFLPSQPNVLQYVFVLSDISNIISYENQLKENKLHINNIYQVLPDLTFIMDRFGNYLYCHAPDAKKLAFKEDEIIGKNIRDLDEKSYALFQKAIRDALHKNELQIFEYWLNVQEGRRYFECRVQPMENGNVLCLVRDITDKTLAIQSLKENEEKNRILSETTFEGLVFVHNNKIIEANNSFLSLFETTYENILDKEIASFFMEEEQDKLFQYLDNITQIPLEIKAKIKEDKTFTAELIAKNIIHKNKNTIVIAIQDISIKKEIELKLIEAQKMDSIGNLAGGVAHDFNNMLGGISGYASLLLLDEKNEEKRNNVKGILNAVKHASDLTQKLLAFGRRGKNIVKPVNINELIMEIIAILNRSISKDISLETKLQQNLSCIDADPSQMYQVIMNLGMNAIEAISKQGCVVFHTAEKTLSTLDALQYGLQPGIYILLSVIDNGKGIDEKLRQKIFDPFFTTKKDGLVKGTGLGLSTVYGIVKNHNGMIFIDENEQQGTKMQVLIPKGKKEKQHKQERNGIIEKGRGKILIIEDEPLIRTMAKKMISHIGYSTLTAENGKKGIEVIDEFPTNIDLILLDMKMPVMDGKKTIVEIRKRNKNIPVLLSTGFGQNEEAQEILDAGANDLLAKPYQMAEISEKIAKLLKKE